ncbi:MAG: HAMP domain-containing protein, partial [Acidobacteria bacterium]|nr:HAMP domain-containing protein [Acidobacteriota bacterium]
LCMAVLVGVLGVLLERTSNAITHELDDLRRSSIEEVMGADGMERALQATQAAAYRLLAERYRELSEISHESGNVWGAVGDLDLEAVDDRLDDFEDALAQTRRAVLAVNEIAHRVRPEVVVEPSNQRQRLEQIEREFGIHKQMLERLVHLMRYHPNEHVREQLQDAVEPHLEHTMGPLIRQFAQAARTDLVRATEAVERLVTTATRRNRWVTGSAFVLALVFGLALSRAISRPLGQLQAAALRFGAGELEHRVEVDTDNEIGVLAQAFNQMAENLRASMVSRTFLDNILQSMREIVLVADSDGIVSTANQIALEELGDGEQSLLGRSVVDLIGVDFHDLEAGAGELELQRADGSTFPASYSRSDLRDPAGKSEGFVFVARDITERRQAEAALRRSLHEKEILLKEVHHRVKNNLQIVSSLLALQEGGLDAGSRGLRESQNRIRSMALIHEHLYQSTDLASIDFSAYLQELVVNLLASYGSRAETIHCEVDILACPLSLDTAVPCGMIVNELVANAVEHAFDADGGKLWVSFAPEDGHQVLRVADDGRGLPEDFDIARTSSLGLRLVSALTSQLGGELRVGVAGGRTEFRVSFTPQEGQVT